jgi:hypothetical protein
MFYRLISVILQYPLISNWFVSVLLVFLFSFRKPINLVFLFLLEPIVSFPLNTDAFKRT